MYRPAREVSLFSIANVAWLYIAQRFAIMLFSILPVTLALMLGAALLFRRARAVSSQVISACWRGPPIAGLCSFDRGRISHRLVKCTGPLSGVKRTSSF